MNTSVLIPRGFAFTARANRETVFDFQLLGEVAIKGGSYFASKATLGDNLDLSIIDKEDILGTGGTEESPVVYRHLAMKWQVVPDQVFKIEDTQIYELLPDGLYFRVSYRSVSQAQDVSFLGNLTSYEIQDVGGD